MCTQVDENAFAIVQNVLVFALIDLFIINYQRVTFPAVLLDVEDQFINWIAHHIPTVGLILLTAWITWWARGRFIDYRNRFVKTESDCSQLNYNQIALNRKLTSIDGKLNTLIIHLSSTKKIDSNLFRTQSPIELTETGSKILSDMGGRDYIESHLDDLINQLQKQGFKSGLDVQNYCSVILNEKMIEDDALIPIKDYIFNNPIYKINDQTSIPIDLTVSVTIMGIYLRNKYFERYPALSKDL